MTLKIRYELNSQLRKVFDDELDDQEAVELWYSRVGSFIAWIEVYSADGVMIARRPLEGNDLRAMPGQSEWIDRYQNGIPS